MLVRSPFRQFNIGGSFDRLFSDMIEDAFRDRKSIATHAQMIEDENGLTVLFDLPGIPAEAITVDLIDRRLSVRAVRNHLTWARHLTIDRDLDLDRISASHIDGRLTVHIGRSVTSGARRIEISTEPLDLAGKPETSIQAESPEQEN